MVRIRRIGHIRRGLRIVAFFEAAKGLLVLSAGFGLLAFIHKDLYSVAEELVRYSHLNPARHYPRIFIDAASRMTDNRLWAIALSALLYSVVRFIEAAGLWLQRQWAQWFGFLTSVIFIPLEVFGIAERATWPKVAVLTVNAAIAGYLAFSLLRVRHANERA
ncbi:MAG TPA: DUF2127 domain-containing protein [Thermodesulfovibrionales bacterium]|nr:DUF2127 domain-containing protein [Thermodesulfovibrionales bacterium]